MLAFVVGDEPGGATTVPQFSELLRGLPANEPVVSDAAFRSVLGLRTSLGYMLLVSRQRPVNERRLLLTPGGSSPAAAHLAAAFHAIR